MNGKISRRSVLSSYSCSDGMSVTDSVRLRMHDPFLITIPPPYRFNKLYLLLAQVSSFPISMGMNSPICGSLVDRIGSGSLQ